MQRQLKLAESWVTTTTKVVEPRPAPAIKAATRSLAASTAPRLRQKAAQAFCVAVIRNYWTAIRASAPLRSPPAVDHKLTVEAEVLALEMAKVAAQGTTEEAAYVIGSAYAAMLPQDFRSEHGIFYTPPLVAERLLDTATEAGVNWRTCRVLDPACGGGAFLGPAARRMASPLKGTNKRIAIANLQHRLHGLEQDGFAAWISLVFLDATLLDVLGFTDETLGAVEVCDSLDKDAEASFDLVIGNPPYGRVTLNDANRKKFARGLYGHANLYGIFLDIGIRHAKANGIVAYVAPTSFLGGEYFKRLRDLLLKEAAPVQVDFVTQRSGVFDDVQQETMLAVFKRGQTARSVGVNFVDVNGALKVKRGPHATMAAEGGAPWILARSEATTNLAARLRSMTHRLADWGYRVSTGPCVWNRHKDQLRQKPSSTTVPLLWAESVTADGKFVFRASRKNHLPYLSKSKDGSDEWLLVRRPCVLVQRTTAKEQHRRLIAAELPKAFIDRHGAITVENHLNMLVPIGDAVVAPSVLAAFLNSGAADRAFRCISGSVAVSAYELEALPLPDPRELRGLAKILSSEHTTVDVEKFCDGLLGEK